MPKFGGPLAGEKERAVPAWLKVYCFTYAAGDMLLFRIGWRFQISPLESGVAIKLKAGKY